MVPIVISSDDGFQNLLREMRGILIRVTIDFAIVCTISRSEDRGEWGWGGVGAGVTIGKAWAAPVDPSTMPQGERPLQLGQIPARGPGMTGLGWCWGGRDGLAKRGPPPARSTLDGSATG